MSQTVVTFLSIYFYEINIFVNKLILIRMKSILKLCYAVFIYGLYYNATMIGQYLTNDQVHEIVSENQYSIPEHKYRGRCFSGEFKNSFHLPALALPGGDLGQLAILLSAAVGYGFEIDMNKAAGELFQLTQGNEHLSNSTAKFELNNCAYFQHLVKNASSYNLDPPSLELLQAQIQKIVPGFEAKNKHTHSHEHALLILESSQGLYPQYTFETYQGTTESRVLIFHKTLVDLRHKVLAKMLVEKQIVTLYEDLDEDYLYEVLSETAELHLFETTNFIDPKLPIYTAKIDKEQNISIKLL
ncbi:hypothetical protein BH09PAT2_BH09PAT2_10740 [soil metagenome]